MAVLDTSLITSYLLNAEARTIQVICSGKLKKLQRQKIKQNEEDNVKKYLFVVAILLASCGGGGDNSTSNNSSSATAVCNDGTLSYSQNCSGTCSSHGGVKTWYINCK